MISRSIASPIASPVAHPVARYPDGTLRHPAPAAALPVPGVEALPGQDIEPAVNVHDEAEAQSAVGASAAAGVAYILDRDELAAQAELMLHFMNNANAHPAAAFPTYAAAQQSVGSRELAPPGQSIYGRWMPRSAGIAIANADYDSSQRAPGGLAAQSFRDVPALDTGVRQQPGVNNLMIDVPGHPAAVAPGSVAAQQVFGPQAALASVGDPLNASSYPFPANIYDTGQSTVGHWLSPAAALPVAQGSVAGSTYLNIGNGTLHLGPCDEGRGSFKINDGPWHSVTADAYDLLVLLAETPEDYVTVQSIHEQLEMGSCELQRARRSLLTVPDKLYIYKQKPPPSYILNVEAFRLPIAAAQAQSDAAVAAAGEKRPPPDAQLPPPDLPSKKARGV